MIPGTEEELNAQINTLCLRKNAPLYHFKVGAFFLRHSVD